MISKLSTLDDINKTNVHPDYVLGRDIDTSNDVGLYNEVTAKTSLIVVPFWVADAIRRNKLDHIDILEYSAVQKIMSIEDMAHFVAINSAVIPGIDGAEYIILNKWREATECTGNSLNQLYRVTEAVNTKQDITTRLLVDNFDIASIENPEQLYQVDIKKDSNVYITVKAGFLNAMNSNEFRKQFYSDVLKKLYSLLPIHMVSTYDLFNHYLKSLR